MPHITHKDCNTSVEYVLTDTQLFCLKPEGGRAVLGNHSLASTSREPWP